jgi:hypothetical protein
MAAITTQTFIEGYPISIILPTPVDPESNVVTTTATLVGSTSLPTFLSYSPSTRKFSGTAALNDRGTYSIKVVMNDGYNTPTVTFSLVI